MSPDYWHRMQGAYDLRRAQEEVGTRIAKEVTAFAE
jgi:plasmid maintenance system antidote protein VapI